MSVEDDGLHVGDAIEFLDAQADDSIDLLITSPPYELARTYGIGDKMVGGEAWVAWMFAVVKAAAPKVKGLIAINCEGQTRDYRYSMTPFLLMADLHRAGFNLRKPCVYERDGIPGSGGPDWLKNRWEPIICITRPGRLPWSDNTACGKAPKFGPGGPASYRSKDGARLMNKSTSGYKGGDTDYRKARSLMPDLANPGNIIDCGANTHFGFGNESEAPFPLELPTFFVKSFCPPMGLVCDPFFGSGTSMEAAITNGRRFIGCDIRESQRRIARRRLKTITPDMFAMVQA